jgi:hypothetical protein
MSLNGAGEQTKTQPGESVGFGKGARNNQIGKHTDKVDHRFAVKMKVRLIDQHHGMRRALSELRSCARVATEPEGLLGLAMATIFVLGVMAASRRSKGNCKSSAACTVTVRASVADA